MRRETKVKQTRHSQRKRFRFQYFFILVFILAIAGSSFWQLWKLHASVDRQLADLNQRKSVLIQEQKRLQDEVVRLNTPSYIEQLAREQLGLVRRGEIMIAPKP